MSEPVVEADVRTLDVNPADLPHPGKVVMLYPHPGDVSHLWHRSVAEMMVFDRNSDLQVFDREIAVRSGANINRARNRLVKGFLETDADWAWFCDTDMVFKPETLLRLVVAAQVADAKIMGGLCVVVHEFGLVPTLFIDDEDTITRTTLDYPDDAVVEVAATGCGCLLVHRSVFEKIQADAGGSDWCWFNEGERHSSTGKPFWVGEDVMFCLTARQAGFPVYVDCSTEIGHWKGNKTWWPHEIRDGHGAEPDELSTAT